MDSDVLKTKNKNKGRMPPYTSCKRSVIRPLIVYTCEPEVVYTDTSNFMRVVQSLTGSSLSTKASDDWNQRKRRRNRSYNPLNGFTVTSEEPTDLPEIPAALSADINEESNKRPGNVLSATIDCQNVNSGQVQSSKSQLNPNGTVQLADQAVCRSSCSSISSSSSDLTRSLSGSSISTSSMQEIDPLLVPSLMASRQQNNDPLLLPTLLMSLNLDISPRPSMSIVASPGTPSISSSCSACFNADSSSVEQDYKELLYVTSSSDKEEFQILPGISDHSFSMDFLHEDMDLF